MSSRQIQNLVVNDSKESLAYITHRQGDLEAATKRRRRVIMTQTSLEVFQDCRLNVSTVLNQSVFANSMP